MKRVVAVCLPLAMGACGSWDTAPETAKPIPAVCEDQVYQDPVVKDLIAKSAGSETYRLAHVDQLKYAKMDAARRCEQQKGLVPPGGGVERPALRSPVG